MSVVPSGAAVCATRADVLARYARAGLLSLPWWAWNYLAARLWTRTPRRVDLAPSRVCVLTSDADTAGRWGVRLLVGADDVQPAAATYVLIGGALSGYAAVFDPADTRPRQVHLVEVQSDTTALQPGYALVHVLTRADTAVTHGVPVYGDAAWPVLGAHVYSGVSASYLIGRVLAQLALPIRPAPV
jgi:hypothetical protein